MKSNKSLSLRARSEQAPKAYYDNSTWLLPPYTYSKYDLDPLIHHNESDGNGERSHFFRLSMTLVRRRRFEFIVRSSFVHGGVRAYDKKSSCSTIKWIYSMWKWCWCGRWDTEGKTLTDHRGVLNRFFVRVRRAFLLFVDFLHQLKNMCSNHQKTVENAEGRRRQLSYKTERQVECLYVFRYISTNLTDQHDEFSSVRPMLEINLDFILISHRLASNQHNTTTTMFFFPYFYANLSLSHHTTIPHFANRCSSQFQTVICNNLP